MRWKIEKVVFTLMSRDQGWEENFEYASGHLIVFSWSSNSRCWLMDMIWRRDLTPGAKQSGVGPPIALPTLVKLMMYFPTNKCFSAVDVLLTIVTNESSIVSDDCMSLDGIRGASIPLNDPGVLRPSIRFYREGHSHKAHLDLMNAAIPV